MFVHYVFFQIERTITFFRHKRFKWFLKSHLVQFIIKKITFVISIFWVSIDSVSDSHSINSWQGLVQTNRDSVVLKYCSQQNLGKINS